MVKQKTINKIVKLEGVGLHSGEKSRITLSPLPPNSGIIFKDEITQTLIPANLKYVSSTERGIVLEKADISVGTPEHLLSAFYAMGISNVLVEYTREIPIMNGSAKPFINLINRAGINEQNEERKEIIISSPITIKDGDKVIVALPNDELRIRYMIDYPNTRIETQYYDFTFDSNYYIKYISPAKTFVLYSEIGALHKKGLAKGGSLENVLIVKGYEVMGNMTLKDEFVKHKVIDFLGDISLLGAYVRGDFILIKTGHEMHIKIARQIENKEA